MDKSKLNHEVIQEEDMNYIINSALPWNDLSGKTVLITGANGLIASYLVETLLLLNDKNILEEPIQVIGLVRNKEKAYNRFSSYCGRDDLYLLVQDVCVAIDNILSVDYIIHAASQASPKYYGKDPTGTLKSNVIGTYNLLEYARKNGVKSFLFISSEEVYGELTDEQIPTSEVDFGPLDPFQVRSCYAESKRMGETMCISWHHQYNVPIKIVRPYHIYGPGMDLEDGRVFADFVADIVNSRNILLNSDGTATRSFCYLADAIVAIFSVFLIGDVAAVYNIGNDRGEISIRGLAELLVDLFPDKNLQVVTEKEVLPGYIRSNCMRTCPDITKLKAIGWMPTFGLADGFYRTIKSYL